jgi:hypothetical protein
VRTRGGADEPRPRRQRPWLTSGTVWFNDGPRLEC